MSAILDAYWKETERPVYSAVLVLPFLLLYHAGTLFSGIPYINGADALIIRILRAFSIHSMFGSALVLAAYFAVWQWKSKAGFSIRWGYLFLSFLESLGLALILLFIVNRLVPVLSVPAPPGAGSASKLALFCGAGIYEELVFRAFLLGILGIFFKKALQMKAKKSAILTAVSGAFLFALFHYLGPVGDVFSLNSFLQRMFGGLYFSAVFVTRGFGVTAVCHAFYDILVGLIFV